MSHPDEGMIQMLLDGELAAADQARLEAHVATCPACAAKVAEARRYQREADELVGMLEVPVMPAALPGRTRRLAPVRALAWAASIVLAVALGYWSRGVPTLAPTGADEGKATPTAQPGTTVAPVEPAAVAAAPVTRQPEQATRQVPKERAADAPAAAPPQPSAGQEVARQDERRVVANELDAAAGMRANQASLEDVPASPPTWRLTTMEDAVARLGGQIRLIDGLTPERVEVGPGTAVPGADAVTPVVRVVYAGGAVILDQQRPAALLARREAFAAGAAKAAAPTESASGLARPVNSWQDRDGFRFVVTGTVSADSLAVLAGRVR